MKQYSCAALIVLAGPLTNLLVAVGIFAAFNLAYGVPTAAPVITTTQAAAVESADVTLQVVTADVPAPDAPVPDAPAV